MGAGIETDFGMSPKLSEEEEEGTFTYDVCTEGERKLADKQIKVPIGCVSKTVTRGGMSKDPKIL